MNEDLQDLQAALQAGSEGQGGRPRHNAINEAQITGRDRTFSETPRDDRDGEERPVYEDAMADATDDCEEDCAPDPRYGGDVAMAEDDGINKIRDFSVKELNYGFLIKVGCHSFAISTAAEAGRLITEYLKDPKGTEAKWYANDLSLKRKR